MKKNEKVIRRAGTKEIKSKSKGLTHFAFMSFTACNTPEIKATRTVNVSERKNERSIVYLRINLFLARRCCHWLTDYCQSTRPDLLSTRQICPFANPRLARPEHSGLHLYEIGALNSQTKTNFPWAPEWASEQMSAMALASKLVSGASEQTIGRANGSVLYASIS